MDGKRFLECGGSKPFLHSCSFPGRHNWVDKSDTRTLEHGMRYCPTIDEYLVLARQYNLVPIYRQLIGDTLTPVSAFCKILEGDWAFLFESVVGGERMGRYSFLGSGPFLRFQAHGRRVSIAGPAAPPVELEHPDPLRLLEERLAA